MQLKGIATLAMTLALSVSAPAAAAEPDPGAVPTIESHEVVDPVFSADIKSTLYFQRDEGGIPQVDEDATVFETLIVLDGKVAEHDNLRGQLLVDVVSSASMRREHNKQYRALQTGASGVVHLQGGLGWTHHFTDVDLGLQGSYAFEYAYQSIGAGAHAAFHLAERNTTLGVSFQGYFDTVRMIRFNGVDEADQARNTCSATAEWTQILTPDSLMNVTFGHTQQTGFLATQYNSVFVDGVEDYEKLPDSRARESLTVRYKHGVFEDDAIEVGGQYYHDDWGADAGTVDLRYDLLVHDQRILLEPSYRFHIQTAIDAYKPSFEVAQQYQTSDPDMGDFMGHMVALRASFIHMDFLGLGGTWDMGASYYYKDNGLHMAWFDLGYHFDL